MSEMKSPTDLKDRFVIIMAGGRGERFWPVSREKNAQAIAHAARQTLVPAAGRGPRAAARAGQKHFRHHQRGATAGSPQTTAENPQGQSHRRTGRPRHLRRRHARRGARRRALDHRRHGRAARRPCDSRGEEIPAGLVATPSTWRHAARPSSPSASSRPSRRRVTVTFTSARNCRRRKARRNTRRPFSGPNNLSRNRTLIGRSNTSTAASIAGTPGCSSGRS